MVSSTPIDPDHKARTARIPSSFASRALWKRFREAESAEAFAASWLALACRFVRGANGGLVVLGEPDGDSFAPVAHWPEESEPGKGLAAAAEHGISQRRAVVLGEAADAGHSVAGSLAMPILVDDSLYGVVAIGLEAGADAQQAMRALQWSIAWLEVMVRREQARSDIELRSRTMSVFDMIAAVLEQSAAQDACHALVTELATHLSCDRVSIGFRDGLSTTVAALSHSVQFGQRMNLIREIAAAMDEAIDQQALVHFPVRREWSFRVTRAHAELAASHRTGTLLTVPLTAHGNVIGALTFESIEGQAFDRQSIETCDAIASVIGPILYEKRRSDRPFWLSAMEAGRTQLRRLFGPRYPGRKLAAVISTLLLALVVLVPGTYRVTSPAVIEGLVQRSIVAPFDGYIAEQFVRAGELVAVDQVLASLDREELLLERLRWSTQRQQSQAEYDQALARQQRAETNIARAQMDQAQAQIELLDAQLARTELRAPFAGVVVSGDLSQVVGSSVRRGDELFRIAPLDQHRVILEVDEADIADLQPGQSGSLRLASLPQAPIAFSVERLTPVSEQADGRNYFRVEALLDAGDSRLRPGMEGVAKTAIDERPLISIWTRQFVDWLRLALWRWTP